MVDPIFAAPFDHDIMRPHQTVEGAREALQRLFPGGMPARVLDVGCGTGTWLRAALDCGASEIFGVDGVGLAAEQLHIPQACFLHADLRLPLDLGRRFDLVICLETAEHLDPESADELVNTLVRHGDRILFSAAAPGQIGIGHVNCQWPSYWQGLFNDRAYACDDSVRWNLWNDSSIEPWYRQNIFMALRDELLAGREERIRSVIHPDMVPWTFVSRQDFWSGALPWRWYATGFRRAIGSRLRRRLGF